MRLRVKSVYAQPFPVTLSNHSWQIRIDEKGVKANDALSSRLDASSI